MRKTVPKNLKKLDLKGFYGASETLVREESTEDRTCEIGRWTRSLGRRCATLSNEVFVSCHSLERTILLFRDHY